MLRAMNEGALHFGAVVAMFVLAGITFASLQFVVAPYGRHVREGWGPQIPSRLGWIVMESPSALGFLWLYFRGAQAWEMVPLALMALWQVHYLHRTFIFPFRMRIGGKKMPLSIVAMAIGFNALNVYVNARWISHLGHYPDSWIWTPQFIAGVGLFFVGFWINVRADQMLANLRKPGEKGYKIPRGWLFEYVVNPNYFGEILEWLGWAIASWSIGGLAFAVYTFANLAPRAVSNLAWYRETFDDFPSGRKAVIPRLL